MRAVTAVAMAVLGTLAWAQEAPAAVDIGPDRIVVTGQGTRAVIERRPYRLTVQDGAGRTVLQEAPSTGAGPLPVAPLPDPIPSGTEPPPRPTLYEPLTFTVGGQRSAEYPASQYVGNQLAGVEAGVQHAARDVVDAAPAGDGVRLTLSTSDPSGRTLVVTVAPDGAGLVRVGARPEPAAGVAVMAASFASDAQEAFRGFGGRRNALDQRGEDFFNWVEQENTSSGVGEPVIGPVQSGGDRYQFPNGKNAAYYVQSQFVSSRPYAFLLDRTELSRWRMASDRPDAWQTSVAAASLDYVVAPGEAKAAIGTLTARTGRHRAPAEWALGPHLDRLVIFPDQGPEVYKRSVAADLRDIPKFGLPLESYRIEGWHFYTRAELRDVIARFRRQNIRPLLYFRAFVGQDTIGTDDPKAYDEAIEKGYVAKNAAGEPYVFPSNFNANAAMIDFTNPEAVRWWQGRIREALDLGADGFMQDFGEQVQTDMRFANGETGATMHNKLPILFHKATREVLDAYEREHPERGKLFFYTRTGYSGTPGSGAYEHANFSGDNTTDFSRSAGLGSLTSDMLNRGVGGLSGFNTDIGGYFDLGPYESTTKELFLRWAQWAVFSPVFRLHGSVRAGTHVPWTFDDETVRLYNDLSRLHIRARPLIGRLWEEAERTGVPVTRPLWLEYPDDPVAAKQDQQWLLGPDLLVAPVVKAGATSREVYFPRGCWQSPETGARFEGPRSARVDAPLASLPYFFRCGTEPFSVPAARRCASRRVFEIRLREPRGRRDRLKSARVRVNGKRVRVKRSRGRLRARVDLRGRPKEVSVVRIVAKTRRGKVVRETRRYHPCVSRVSRGPKR